MLETDASDVTAGVVWTSKKGGRHYARVDENFVFRLGALLSDGCQRRFGKLRCVRRRLCDYLSECLQIARSSNTNSKKKVKILPQA